MVRSSFPQGRAVFVNQGRAVCGCPGVAAGAACAAFTAGAAACGISRWTLSSETGPSGSGYQTPAADFINNPIMIGIRNRPATDQIRAERVWLMA
jgi:hypothetical protein